MSHNVAPSPPPAGAPPKALGDPQAAAEARVPDPRPARDCPFRVRPFHSEFRREVDANRLQQLADELEIDDAISDGEAPRP